MTLNYQLITHLGSIPSCPAEEIFLCRLLQSDSIEKNGSEERLIYIKEALALRHSSTLELMKLIEDTIQALMCKIESIDQSFLEKSTTEGRFCPYLEVNFFLTHLSTTKLTLS